MTVGGPGAAFHSTLSRHTDSRLSNRRTAHADNVAILRTDIRYRTTTPAQKPPNYFRTEKNKHPAPLLFTSPVPPAPPIPVSATAGGCGVSAGRGCSFSAAHTPALQHTTPTNQPGERCSVAVVGKRAATPNATWKNCAHRPVGLVV